MTTELELKLNNLVGRTFKHESINFKVIQYRHKHDKYVLVTDRRTFVMFRAELEDLLNNIELIEKDEETIPSAKSAPIPLSPKQEASLKLNLQIYEPTESQKTIQNALMDALQKVVNDEKFIPQAKSICDIANTLVNMEKNQIALMNAVKRR